MKAIKLRAPGGLDYLELIDLPEPEAPSAGEIRVRLHASSLNYHDYRVVTAANPTHIGRIPMADGAGVVEAVGEGVTEFSVGDHVVSTFFPTWLDGPPELGDFGTVPGRRGRRLRAGLRRAAGHLVHARASGFQSCSSGNTDNSGAYRLASARG